MTGIIEICIDHARETRLVGQCRYVAKRHGQSSVFEYADEWLDYRDAFALDPANLALGEQQVYTRSNKSALPGALRDSVLDRWGQQLIKRAFSCLRWLTPLMQCRTIRRSPSTQLPLPSVPVDWGAVSVLGTDTS